MLVVPRGSWTKWFHQNWKLGLSDRTLTTYPPSRLKKHVDTPDGITPKNPAVLWPTGSDLSTSPEKPYVFFVVTFWKCWLGREEVCVIPSWLELSFNVLCWTLITHVVWCVYGWPSPCTPICLRPQWNLEPYFVSRLFLNITGGSLLFRKNRYWYEMSKRCCDGAVSMIAIK